MTMMALKWTSIIIKYYDGKMDQHGEQLGNTVLMLLYHELEY